MSANERMLHLLGIGGVTLRFSPHMPSTTFVVCESPFEAAAYFGCVPPVIIFHSPSVVANVLRGVLWHDDALNCRTWAGECRCDLAEDA